MFSKYPPLNRRFGDLPAPFTYEETAPATEEQEAAVKPYQRSLPRGG